MVYVNETKIITEKALNQNLLGLGLSMNQNKINEPCFGSFC